MQSQIQREWYTPIRLIPDNGRLLTGYLAVLHLAVALVLIPVLPVPVSVLSAMALAIGVLWHGWRRVASGKRLASVVIRQGRQIVLTDPQLQSREARLIAFRVIGGLAFMRARESDRSISLCFRQRDQDAAQWHRLILMQRCGTKASGEDKSG